MNAPDDESTGCRKSFLEHLEDLRRTIIYSFLFLVIGISAAIPLVPYVIELMKQPLVKAGKADVGDFIIVGSIGGGFDLVMKTSIWTGILFAIPFITMAVASFIYPGLRKKEQKTITAGIVSAVVFFISGAVFCYYFVLPIALNVMLRMNDWAGVKCPWVMVDNFASFVIMFMIAFGLAFELPVVLVTLGMLGIVTYRQLSQWRSYAVIVILILAAILTPPDIFSQVLMAVPMYILYEVCIVIIWFINRGDDKDSPS